MKPIGAGIESRRHYKQNVDALVDEYVRWREESLMVHRAYDLWLTAPPRERWLAHAAYSAALDREGEAAASYQRHLEQAVAR
jgi:hypothetical protein